MKKLNLFYIIILLLASLTSCDKPEPIQQKETKSSTANNLVNPLPQKNKIVVKLTSDEPRNIEWFSTKCQRIDKWAENSAILAKESLDPNSYQAETKATQESLEKIVMAMTTEYNLEAEKVTDSKLFKNAKLPNKIDNPHALTCSKKSEQKASKKKIEPTKKAQQKKKPKPPKNYEWFVKECSAIIARRDEIYDSGRDFSGFLRPEAEEIIKKKYGAELVKRARRFNTEAKKAKRETPEIFFETSLITHITNVWELEGCI